MVDKSSQEVKRHPLAIAWDEWLASNEGQSCRSPHPGLARESPYLENRLHRAFTAGASTAQSQLAEAVLEELSVHPGNPIEAVICQRLRALFSQLGVEVE